MSLVRVGESHVLSFTLHFSYMCFLCYTRWQVCVYVYVHVAVCRRHGTCVHVWRTTSGVSLSFLSSLRPSFYCLLLYTQAGWLTRF